MKTAIGISMIVAPFVVIFVVAALKIGLLAISGVFASSAFLVFWIWVAVEVLLKDSHNSP